MLRNPKKELIPGAQTVGCYDRCPREEQFIRHYIDTIPFEDIEKLYQFLQGDVPPELTLDHPPKLTSEEAFSIIYYLQEIMGLLPDRYDRCRECGDLYDSYTEGTTIDVDSEPMTHEDDDGNEVTREWAESEYGNYCDSCRPD